MKFKNNAMRSDTGIVDSIEQQTRQTDLTLVSCRSRPPRHSRRMDHYIECNKNEIKRSNKKCLLNNATSISAAPERPHML